MKRKNPEWEGYTMAELQMHKAINAVKLEVEKERFYSRLEGLKEGATGNIASYLIKNIGTLSKGLAIASATIGIGRRIYGIFKK